MRVAVAVVVVAAAGGLALTYGARRTLARDALIGWLEARGIESEVEFSTFDLGAVDGRLRIGPRRDPDVVAELAEVRYGLTGFWNGEPFGIAVTSVRLVRPVVKASFKDGEFSLGSLDPLVEEFSRRPPQPDRAKPRIVIEGGRIALDTDYGRMSARADARLEDGRLMLLNAQVAPARLQGRGLAAAVGEVQIRAATTGRRIDVLVAAPVRRLAVGQTVLEGATLRFDAKGPYPDLERRRGDGDLFARLALQADSLSAAGTRLADLRLNAQFDGTSAGWLETLVLAGDATATLSAERAQVAGVQARAIQARANATNLKWGRKGGDVVAAQLWTEIKAATAEAADARLVGSTLVASGPVGFSRGELSFALRGHADGRGGWSGLGAPAASDPPETAALKRALRDVRFQASAFEVALDKGTVTARLPTPLRASFAGGGEAVLSAAAGQPLYRDGVGAFRLTSEGGGLPKVDLAVDRYRIASSGDISAGLRLSAAGDFGPLVGASLKTAGEARLADGALSFTARGCTPLSLERMELGENDAEAIRGELCPTAAPLLTFADGAWRVRGTARDVVASVPFLELRAEAVAGPVDLGGRGEDLRVDARLRAGRVIDTAAEQRFNPVQASGEARLAGGVWAATFQVADPAGRRLGEAKLAHRPDGTGGMDFDTGVLAFAEGGLQPADLSPLAALIGAPATGQARFLGQMAWTPQTTTSGGVLTVERLDFHSPAGPVTGLSGTVAFTSLVPLEAAPGQVLRAERIDTAAPLTDAEVTFGVGDETLKVSGATFAVEGGTLTLEPFEIPFAPNPTWSGVLQVDGVQIKDLVEASPFGDQMDMEAKLTGRIPFQVTPQGVRVSAGRLYAVEPGRLSIRRGALSGVEADGALETPEGEVAPAPPNTFTEFAYQAMEHLAFDRLEADINSQEGGRLGVLFRIKGRHSPPKRQEIRLSWLDVIRQTYLEKSLPLPSGTEVDLTLDTSVNLDELLRDFADYQALRSSQAVQPSP